MLFYNVYGLSPIMLYQNGLYCLKLDHVVLEWIMLFKSPIDEEDEDSQRRV